MRKGGEFESEGYDRYRVVSRGGQAYDFAGNFKIRGRDYEEYCHQQLAQEIEGDTVLLGPGVTNYVFEQPFTAGVVKPDMLGFRLVTPQMWELATLWECKNSRHLGATGKLKGYRELLGKLREKPFYLSSSLQDFESDLSMPHLVGIPEERDLEVVFISPFPKEHLIFPAYDFQVSYRQIERRRTSY